MMTNEEANNLRNTILRAFVVGIEFYDNNRAAEKALDALCAAAREPESLVGKTVRVVGGEPKFLGDIIAGPFWRVQFPLMIELLTSSDFEVLESGDAE